jgi:hypothetical protein
LAQIQSPQEQLPTPTGRIAPGILLSFVVLCLATGAAAEAQPRGEGAGRPGQDKERASRLLTEGSALFHKKDYAGALEKFRQAHRAYPSCKLVYNIAVTLHQLDRAVEAARQLSRFQAHKSCDVPAEVRDDARARLRSLDRRLARLAVGCREPGVRVLVDRETLDTTPVEGDLYLSPGTYEVRLVSPAPGGELSLRLELQAGQRGRVDGCPARPAPEAAESAAQARPPVEARPDRPGERGAINGAPAGARRTRSKAWLISGITTAVLAVGFEVTAWIAYDKANGLLNDTSAFRTYRDLTVASHVVAGTCAAAAITSFILYYYSGKHATAKDGARVSLVPLGQAGVSARIRF